MVTLGAVLLAQEVAFACTKITIVRLFGVQAGEKVTAEDFCPGAVFAQQIVEIQLAESGGAFDVTDTMCPVSATIAVGKSDWAANVRIG